MSVRFSRNFACRRGRHFFTGKYKLKHMRDMQNLSINAAAATPALTRFPGFCDVHVHFREPGFEYKETIFTGSVAAAAGGYTAVCAMPNLNPVPDCAENLKLQTDIIKKTAAINVYPYGSISKDEKGIELSDMEGMCRAAESVSGLNGGMQAAGFSDDGRGVQSEELMRRAMIKARSLGKIIAAHCEDAFTPAPDSEWIELERNLRLSKETGCPLHICHVSTRQSVQLIRTAKAAGVNVTAETAPHYLLLDSAMITDEIKSGRFRMNPPIGSSADKEALIEALVDGTIDMIATDHAPHSAEEKSRGFEKSLPGIVGLETAFPLLYTYLVKPGVISMDRLIELLSEAPAKRFSIKIANDDYSLWDLKKEYFINPENFLSKGKASPFEGWKVFGECIKTVCGGKTVWQREKI